MSRNDAIRETESRYTGVRHVPDGLTAYEVISRNIRNYDPIADEEQIEQEVRKTLKHVLYAVQLQTANPIPVWCKSQAVKDRVEQRISSEQRSKVTLRVCL